MSEDGTTSRAPLPDPTDVRFSTRSMLVIMAVIAIAATSLGAFLRQFPAEAQIRLWIWWGALVAIMIAVAFIYARLRFRAENKAGRVLFQLAPHSYLFPRAPRLATFLLGTLLLASAPAMWVFGTLHLAKPNPSWIQVLNWATFYALIASGLGVTYFWWNGRVRLAENGVVIRHEFVPWQKILKCEWDDDSPNVLVLKFHRTTALCVPDNARDGVAALLKEKLANYSPS